MTIFSEVSSCFVTTDLLCSSKIHRAAVSSAIRRASASRRALRAAILSYEINDAIRKARSEVKYILLWGKQHTNNSFCRYISFRC